MRQEKQYGKREICIVSKNEGKINEIREVLNRYQISLIKCNAEKLEIQDEDINKIAIYAAINAYNEAKTPLILDDSALYIKSLNGFPGPYTSYVYKTIGINGILKLMTNVDNRSALFKTSLVYIDENGYKLFEGSVEGIITDFPKGKNGFGFDPIFRPINSNKTFAEMDILEKNNFSHRAKAVTSFAEWHRKNYY